jgi:glutamate-1-semialdehyde aminotransferase
LTYTFNYNDIESVIESIDSDTACVILEPVVFEEPRENFLHNLKDVCTRNGTLLIFDEMWTGFRIHLGGAQEYYGIKADLACFSKAIANGMPLSVLTGRREIMSLLDKDVFFFTTFGGEALSLAAAKATINEMRDYNVADYIWEKGKTLKDGFNELAGYYGIDYVKCSGLNCRSMVTFDAKAGDPLLLKSLLQQELFKRGILWSGFHNISYSHSVDDIEYTLEAFEASLRILKRAVDNSEVVKKLKGMPVEPVFRKTSNFHTKPRNAAAV